MKKFFGFLIFLFFFNHLNAQANFGLKLGLHSTNYSLFSPDPLLFSSGDELGFHLGPVLRLKLSNFILEGGMVASSEKVNFDNTAEIIGHRFYSAEVPVLLRVKFLFVDLHGGINSKYQIGNFSIQERNRLNGIIGASLYLIKINIDFDFEFNPTPLEFEIEKNGVNYLIQDKLNRFNLSVIYKI